jgi:hypothetical protein
MKYIISENTMQTSNGLRDSGEPRRLTRFFVLKFFCFFFALVLASSAWAGTNLKLQTATGITMTASGNDYTSSFGTMNGLGAGTPSAGVSVQTVAGGAFYFSTVNFQLQGGPASSVTVTAYVSTQFGHPAALIMQSCPNTATCTSSANYQTLPTVAGSAIVIVNNLNKNAAAVTASIGIFVPYNNGASAFAGTDSVEITLVAKNGATTVDTTKLMLNNPAETLQTAIGMTLSTAPSGVNISSSADFSLNFGNVNGLGISPAAGLTTSNVAGGILYSTPYLFQPSFAGFGVTAATVSVYVSSNFVHPAILELRDSTTTGGPYTAISNVQGSPTVFGSTFSNLSSNQRFLGLFVSSVNGATSFTGADTAILTFTTTPQ